MTSSELDRLRRKHQDFVAERLGQYTEGPNVEAVESDDELALLAMQKIDPEARLHSWLSARLHGHQVRYGAIGAELLSDISGSLQDELQSAIGNRAAASLELVGISGGSAILHFEPLVEIRDSLNPAGTDELADRAISHILAAHDLIEAEGDIDELRDRYSDLLENLAKLTSALSNHAVELDISWRSAEGGRRPVSHLGQRGIEYAKRLFEREATTELISVRGFVFGASLTGELVIKKAIRMHSPTHKVRVDPAELRRLGLSLGDLVEVQLEKHSMVDKAGRATQATYRFVELLEHRPTLDE